MTVLYSFNLLNDRFTVVFFFSRVFVVREELMVVRGSESKIQSAG